MSDSGFDGFPAGTMKFLNQLKRNNSREWFSENKDRYESLILKPSLAFIQAMQKPVKRLSECVDVIPKRSGGSLMRIYRDTRFSRDKTPYKTNIGIHFRHVAGKDVHAPGFYVHIEPGNVFLGAGIWHPNSTALTAIREHIEDQPLIWKRVSNGKTFRRDFELSGDSLKRPPRGYDAEHPLIADLKRKDFIGLHQMKTEAIENTTFIRDTVSAFKSSVPFVRFLCSALNLPL